MLPLFLSNGVIFLALLYFILVFVLSCLKCTRRSCVSHTCHCAREVVSCCKEERDVRVTSVTGLLLRIQGGEEGCMETTGSPAPPAPQRNSPPGNWHHRETMPTWNPCLPSAPALPPVRVAAGPYAGSRVLKTKWGWGMSQGKGWCGWAAGVRHLATSVEVIQYGSSGCSWTSGTSCTASWVCMEVPAAPSSMEVATLWWCFPPPLLLCSCCCLTDPLSDPCSLLFVWGSLSHALALWTVSLGLPLDFVGASCSIVPGPHRQEACVSSSQCPSCASGQVMTLGDLWQPCV